MHISHVHRGQVTVVHLEGDFLGEPDQKKFRDWIRELTGHGGKHVVLDLTRVKHMNSCGLGSLVCALTTLRRAGGDMCLAGVAAGVQDLLLITQLNKIFEYRATVEEAVGYFEQPHRA